MYLSDAHAFPHPHMCP